MTPCMESEMQNWTSNLLHIQFGHSDIEIARANESRFTFLLITYFGAWPQNERSSTAVAAEQSNNKKLK